METDEMLRGEWDVSVLRPVARWVPVIGDDGRRRLEMRWAVPDLDKALQQVAVTTA